ncbi:MAG: AAA family ATPase [Candidatus Eisenbacteria bacterium]|nr:AAA family ATPase [Candidatus Latescibacterota bacterium]MBD3300908.1 AAA family ATPase [Candidatus Eisenbacteria bacterium]
MAAILDLRLNLNNYSSMIDNQFRLAYHDCRNTLLQRLEEPAPSRIQLLSGPRQVGKTTLLLELAKALGDDAVYAAADAPEASLPGFLDRLFNRARKIAASRGRAIVLLDEVHLISEWAARLKGVTDDLKRRKEPIHVVATGSAALRLGSGSRETLAGRFERLILSHWSASSLAETFRLEREAAAEFVVRMGSYPGAFSLRTDEARWSAYIRDSILEPAIGRDILALSTVRRPALLRQIFGIAASSPAQILSLQKIRGQLQDRGALETVAHYLALLEEAFLVASIQKFSKQDLRRRASPPKLVTLNNALISSLDPMGIKAGMQDAPRYGSWVENACLAHAWNSGQRLWYWREESLEVDGILEGSWGSWAIEVKTGRFQIGDLAAILEFCRRNPRFQPLLLCRESELEVAERAGVQARTWKDFLLDGPPS